MGRTAAASLAALGVAGMAAAVLVRRRQRRRRRRGAGANGDDGEGGGGSGGTGGTGGDAAGIVGAGAGLSAAVGTGPNGGRVAGAMPTRRLARHGALARMGGRVGLKAAVNRARYTVADPGRRAELDADLQLHTAEEVVQTLGRTKGALMKLGQLASFVDDGMPEPVRQALEQLQQDAPPMSPRLAAQVIAEELGGPPERVFADWDPVPLAAASIGQVHRARTHDGQAVAVKVQYPGSAEAIDADLANLDLMALALPMMWRSLDGQAVAEELRARIREELDYRQEADNQRLFADWYRDHPFIHIPEVVDELSTGRVLTTELATGARFQDLETWDQEQRNLAAETVYRFVFGSLYRLRAFNGDPHPGNYLFRPDGRVSFLDFGLVKRFDHDDVAVALRIAQAAVVEPDLGELRRAVEDAGYLVPGAPISDERMAEHHLMFWEPVANPGPWTITSEWASNLIRRYMFGSSEFGDVLEWARVPPQWVVLQRINLGLFAILGRLEATADWRGIAEEVWPMVAGPPVSPLGELEARWLDGNGDRPR